MKLYVVLENDTDKVIAISEEEKDVSKFVLRKNSRSNVCYFIKVKGPAAEKAAIVYEDLYLEEVPKLDIVLTRIERNIITDIIGEEKSRLNTTIDDLNHYLDNYTMSAKERKSIEKTLTIVERMKKTKNLISYIDLNTTMGFLNRAKNIVEMFRDKIVEATDQIFIWINYKE